MKMEYDAMEMELEWKNRTHFRTDHKSIKINISKFESLKPHLLYVLRVTLGTLLTAILVVVLSDHLTPTAQFFATVIPPLALGRNSVGETLRTAMLVLPPSIASCFVSALVLESLLPPANLLSLLIVLLFLG